MEPKLNFSKLRDKLESFDFTTLDLSGELTYPIFYDRRTDAFVKYPDDVDIEIAERQNPVVFVGHLSGNMQKKGYRPDISEEETRIKTHHTYEYK